MSFKPYLLSLVALGVLGTNTAFATSKIDTECLTDDYCVALEMPTVGYYAMYQFHLQQTIKVHGYPTMKMPAYDASIGFNDGEPEDMASLGDTSAGLDMYEFNILSIQALDDPNQPPPVVPSNCDVQLPTTNGVHIIKVDGNPTDGYTCKVTQ